MVAKPSFRYHANAHVLSGRIERPRHYKIEAQASTALPATGGHGQSSVEDFRINGILSFSRGYSHVSGGEEVENGKTIHTSRVTAVVERLNVLQFVTADRIVARLTSEHDSEQPEGHIIAVGSHFDGLRLGGYDVKVTLRHDLLINSKTFADLQTSVRSYAKTSKKAVLDDEVALFSLVEKIETDLDKVPGVEVEGHVIRIPHFGQVALAEVSAVRGTRMLTMLRFQLGSPTEGHLVVDRVEAGSRVESTRRARYANAALLDPTAHQPLDPQSSLGPGSITRLRLDIGPLSPESQVTPVSPGALVPPFPDAKLPADIKLDVMVSSTDFGVAADIEDIRKAPATIAHGRFFLPGNGSRATVPGGGNYLIFFLRAPDHAGQARCRTGYYYRNSLVQSQQLVANVGQPGGFEIKTDFTLSDDLTDLEGFPERPRLSILTNANGDGTHQIILRKPGTMPDPTAQGQTFSVREKIVGDIVTDLRAILRERAPSERRRPQAVLREDLVQLAPKGRELWRQVPGQNPHMFAALEKDPASYVIQVTRPTTSGFVFPWAFIYDIPLNTDKPGICKLVTDWDGQKPLVSGSPRECPCGPHYENVLCPFGFWGFRYSIDQLSSTKDSVFSISAPDMWDFVIAETQYGVNIKALSNHVHQLRTILLKRFPSAQVREGKDKNAIRGLLGNDLPLVYFYCHGEKPYDADPNTYLGVGMNESIKATELQDWVQTWLKQDKMIWNKIRPLVFVNACHSLEIHPETLVSYLDAFVGSARAAGVIGTEVRINQDLAMRIAEQFFDLLLVQQKTVDGKPRPFTVDEALHTIRLDYLAAGNLLGLLYTPYCWAELCVTRQQTRVTPS